jgi:hypothetical protein
MRLLISSLSLALAAGFAAAWAGATAEEVPPEQIQVYAPLAIQNAQAQFPNPPVKVDHDLQKVTGYHVQEKVGVFLFPDKNLSAKAAAEAGEKGIPVGVLVTKDLSLSDNGTAVPADRLAILEFGGAVKLPLFFLSLVGKGEERLLEVFSKDGKALAQVPLKKLETPIDSSLRQKLTNIDLEKKQVDVELTVGGSYFTTLHLAVTQF